MIRHLAVISFVTLAFEGIAEVQPSATPATARTTIEADALHLPTVLEGDAQPEQRIQYNALGWPLEVCAGEQQAVTCTRFEYDAVGRVTRTEVRDGAGTIEAATETDYDVLGMPTRIRTWVEGSTWLEETRTYDANRNLIAVDAPNRAPVTMTYDGRNRLTSVTTADGTETYAYTPSGQLQSRTDRHGETWTTEFDAYERPAISKDPDGHFALTERDALGRVVRTAACEADGTLLAQTFYEYDALDRLVAERQWLAPADDPENGTTLETRAEYDAAGRVTKVVTPEGDETTHLYDLLGRPWSTEHAKSGTPSLAISRLFDPRGNVLEETHTGTDGSFTTGYAYDALDRLERVRPGNQAALETRRAYNARGLVTQTQPPGVGPTLASYDGLGRQTRLTRPEGIEQIWQYLDGQDAAELRYIDAAGSTTTTLTDGLGRPVSMTYPDGTQSTMTYSALGEPLVETQPDGTTVTRAYDKRSAPLSRTVAPPVGETAYGTTSIGWTRDPLGRATQALLDGQFTQTSTYDTLSRRTQETQGAFTLDRVFDDVGRLASLEYPSTPSPVAYSYDAADRITQIAGPSTAIGYTWRGSQPTQRTVDALTTTSTYDDAQRLDRVQILAGANLLLDEALAWEDRGLKATSARLDLGSATQSYTYDAAGRLTRAAWIDGGESLPSTPEAWSYIYDSVENLKQRQIEGSLALCQSPTTEMPDDGSGRHRPNQVGDTLLDWNERGNLVRKGNQRFDYDAENRLIEVRDATSDALIARYAYDVDGRRILREVNGTVLATVWDGWRAIEEHDVTDAQNSFLTSRRVFGVGLDEIAQLEQRLGGAMEAYHPVYDSIGNVVAMADDSGALVERYLYDPHGERSIWLDTTPPEIHQVRIENGKIMLEATEALRAIDASQITLSRPSDSATFPVTVTQPVTTGRMTHRRVQIELTGAPPAAGDSVQLTIASADLVDLWGHEAATGLDETWIWQPAIDSVLADTQPPTIEEAVAEDGTLRVVFSEPIDTTQLATVLAIDGSAAPWTAMTDGYGLETALTGGQHTLTASLSDALDLDGRSLDHPSAAIGAFTIASGSCDVLHAEPESELLAASSVGNVYGFHGRPHDVETGFVYIRNRYYDPNMGRFIQPDPLRYVDGPNLSQFALNNPANYGDPLGLECMGLGSDETRCTDYTPYFPPGPVAERYNYHARQLANSDLTLLNRALHLLAATLTVPFHFVETLGRDHANMPYDIAAREDLETDIEARAQEMMQSGEVAPFITSFPPVDPFGRDPLQEALVAEGWPQSAARPRVQIGIILPGTVPHSIRSRMRSAGLSGLPGGSGSAQTGPFRYRPPRNYNPANPLPRGPNGGYLDRFDNEWIEGSAHGLAGNRGFAREWDVQLSSRGETRWGRHAVETAAGGRYLNVTPDGRLSHPRPRLTH